MIWKNKGLYLIKTKWNIRNICLILGSLATGVLVALPSVKALGISMTLSLVTGYLLMSLLSKTELAAISEKKTAVPVIILLFFLGRIFYYRWLPSGIVSRIASKVGLNSNTFLIITIVLISVVSSFFLSTLIVTVLGLILKLDQARSDNNVILTVFLSFTVVALEYYQLVFSALSAHGDMFETKPAVLLLNILVLLWINGLILLFIRNVKITLFVSSTVIMLYSFINFFTVLFHGSPFYFSELKNVGTALNVLGNYRINLTFDAVYLILIWILEIYITINISNNIPKWSLKMLLAHIILLFVSWSLLSVGLLHVISRKQQEEAWMPWYSSVSQFGYVVCFAEDAAKGKNPVRKPDGYNEESLRQALNNKTKKIIENKTGNSQPDIILILNESFSDLHVISSIDSDVDYLEDFYGIDGATYGYAVVPNEGGGTNNSEFELLMSKSMYLMNLPAPFTYLSDDLLSRSLISYLQSFGYDTVAMHCAVGENYSRNTAYQAMGFDQIHFQEDFTELNTYGNRVVLDRDDYKDVNRLYQTMKSEVPHFIYLLTYQNHGGYEQNSEELDTVHIRDDLGDLTDDVNEYLSSVKLSGEAFRELTEYYSQVDRDVIICMVGDHVFPFVSELPFRDNLGFADETISRRTVPYVIWSNCGVEISSYKEYVSMVDLAPMVLQAAGLPLSTYYNNLLDLHEQLPIRTSDGKYIDRKGTMGIYNPDSEYYKQMSLYYNMEYNSLLGEDEYMEELFEP